MISKVTGFSELEINALWDSKLIKNGLRIKKTMMSLL